MTNKQRLILIGIFVVTLVIGLTSIVVLNVISSPKTQTQTQTTNTVPSLTSAKLYCTSTANNTSLTIIWTAPSNVPGTDSVYGQISDASTQASPVAFGPIPVGQGSYTFTSADGIDTYYASLWIQDQNGNKSTISTTNQINSAQCTSGSQPTPVASTATTTPTPTSTPTPTATTAQTGTPTPTPTQSTGGSLACNSFAVTQNGKSITNNTIAPGSSTLTITSGITASGGTLNYSSAQWSISPSTPALTVSTSGSSTTWTPPSSTSNGTSYTISLAGVSDSAGDQLSSPCTLTLTLSGTLPNTAGGQLPDRILLIIGLASILAGLGIFFKTNRYE